MQQLTIVLDGERAEKLTRLAQRLRVEPGAVARSLLSKAIDDADPDASDVVHPLDSIPGAHDRARLGLCQAAAGETIPLDAL